MLRDLFRVLKSHHCPFFDYLLVDFELAIAQAAETVMPKIEVRGCNFHFQQKFVLRKAKVQRWAEDKVSPAVSRLLSLLPFLSHPHSLLLAAVRRLQLSGAELFKNLDFKMLSYVHSTYNLRLGGRYRQDLSRLLVRTNNSSEGFFSGLSRRFAVKMRLRDFSGMVSVVFKRDVVRPIETAVEKTDIDRFLLGMQSSSKYAVEWVLRFCEVCEDVKSSNGGKLLKQMEAANFAPKRRVSRAEEQEAKEELDSLVREHHRFSQARRAEFNRFRDLWLRGLLREVDPETMTMTLKTGSTAEEGKLDFLEEEDGGEVQGFGIGEGQIEGMELEEIELGEDREDFAGLGQGALFNFLADDYSNMEADEDFGKELPMDN